MIKHKQVKWHEIPTHTHSKIYRKRINALNIPSNPQPQLLVVHFHSSTLQSHQLWPEKENIKVYNLKNSKNSIEIQG